MKKGMLFIDGSNVYYDYRKSANSKLNIEKYIDYVKRQSASLLSGDYRSLAKEDGLH